MLGLGRLCQGGGDRHPLILELPDPAGQCHGIDAGLYYGVDRTLQLALNLAGTSFALGPLAVAVLAEPASLGVVSVQEGIEVDAIAEYLTQAFDNAALHQVAVDHAAVVTGATL